MFLLPTSFLLQEGADRARTTPRGAPATRLDVYRHRLEYTKMLHLDSLRVADRQHDIARAYARREQLALALPSRTPFTLRVRNSLASILMSAGERLRTGENHASAPHA